MTKRALIIATKIGMFFLPMIARAQSNNYVTPCDPDDKDCLKDSLFKIPFPSFFQKSKGPAGQYYLGNTVLGIIDIALLVVGSIAVLFLIFGGFRYVTAFGNEEQTESAKKIIKNSIIGLLIVIMSFAIIAIITNVVVQGQP